MCNIGKFFKRALDIDVEPPQLPNGGQATSQAGTQDEIAKALRAQSDAQAAEAAAAEVGSAQQAEAAKRRRGRLNEPGSIGSFFNAGAPAPATAAVRQLFGS